MPGSPAVGNFVAGGIAAVKSAATAAAVGDQKEEGKTLDNLKNGSGAEKVGAGAGLLVGDAGRTIAETVA